MEASVGQTFSSELHERTKDAHDESDKHINLKLAAVLTDTKLWAQALAEFYFIFREIEVCLQQHNDNPIVGPISQSVLNGHRTAAFEKDLEFYLGKDWKELVKPSSCTVTYCQRISEVSETQPFLLIAYVHSMYLALLAGGQLIKKVVKKTLGLSGDDGLEIFNYKVADRTELRKQLKDAIDQLDLTDEQKEAIINEKLSIFRMNNAIASSLQATWSNYWRLVKLVSVVAVVPVICIILFHMFS